MNTTKLLLLCDDYWHPGDVPENGIKPLETKGYCIDVIKDGADFDPGMLSRYHAVILAKCNQRSQADDTPWITGTVEQGFAGYVESGGGLIVIHSGTVLGDDTEVLNKLIGCRFVFHPNNCPVTAAPILNHPVTEGVELFCEIDEHYRLEISADDLLPVMASYSAAQGQMSEQEQDPYHNAAAWLGAAGLVRRQGKGRVCVLTPGHLLPVWLNPEFQKTLENAVKWVSYTFSAKSHIRNSISKVVQ